MENNSLSLYGFDQISIIHTILTGWWNSNQEEIRKQKVNLNFTYLKIKNEKKKRNNLQCIQIASK